MLLHGELPNPLGRRAPVPEPEPYIPSPEPELWEEVYRTAMVQRRPVTLIDFHDPDPTG
jgi:hypothetical protein